MNLPDSNIWLGLVLSKHSFHDAASHWLATHTRAKSVLFCRSTMQSLLQLLTVESVMRQYQLSPMSNDEAWELVWGLFADSRIACADEPGGIEPYWKRFACRPVASPKVWMDAYLAAFAVAGGHRIVTGDQAFAQYKGLDLQILLP